MKLVGSEAIKVLMPCHTQLKSELVGDILKLQRSCTKTCNSEDNRIVKALLNSLTLQQHSRPLSQCLYSHVFPLSEGLGFE